MSSKDAATGSGTDEWVESWLSVPRFAVYLAAAGQDRGQAAALYEWNAMVAAAFHHDLAHLEVALRNAYDRALSRNTRPGQPHWVFEPVRHFPRQMQKAANGKRFDANETSRQLIADAVKNATPKVSTTNGPPPQPAAGKVIAELSFGFWRYLTSRRQHDPLWVPYLHRAFRSGTSRQEVDGQIGRLHGLRNRIAHHEPLLSVDLASRHQDLMHIAKSLSVDLADYITSHTSCNQLLPTRPVLP
jgi:hypothetical protein